jgi:hypothetical protein
VPAPAMNPKDGDGDPFDAEADKSVNNCYNYAVNRKFKKKAGKDSAATPGKKGNKECGLVTPDFGTNGKPIYTCWCSSPPERSLADALGGDGLEDVGKNLAAAKAKCNKPECWLVAAYSGDATVGDYHFVREYENPGGDKGWSQMCGAGGVVTDKCHYPGTGHADQPIKDPAKDLDGSGYKFCGYFCCCGDTVDVAMVDRSTSTAVWIADCTKNSGKALPLVSAQNSSVAATALGTLIERLGDSWTEGFGEGDLMYRIDIPTTAHGPSMTVLVNDGSVTLWDGPDLVGASARSANDPHDLGQAFAKLVLRDWPLVHQPSLAGIFQGNAARS